MNKTKKMARERNMTARAAAKIFNKSPRTIQRLVALDRDDYLKRAAEKREKVWKMRSIGHSWCEISEAVDTTYGGARSLYYQYVKHSSTSENEDNSRDTKTIDMFADTECTNL